MREVVLNVAEQKFAKYIASCRLERGKAMNHSGSKEMGEAREIKEINSAGGELAFCKSYNLFPFEDDEGPHLADAVMPNGLTVDVKTTRYPTGSLMVPVYKTQDKSCNLYVLVTGEFPCYQIIGAVDAKDVFVEARIKNPGYGEAYIVEQSELYDLYDDGDLND